MATTEPCFVLVVSTRRLNDKYIRKSETTYSLSQCVQFCVEETDFKCRGFAYRNSTADRDDDRNALSLLLRSLVGNVIDV